MSSKEKAGTLNEIVYEGLHQLAAQIKYNNKQVEGKNTAQTSVDGNEILQRLKLTIGLV